MFKKLSNHITIIIIFSFLTFNLVVGIFSYTLAKKIIVDQFTEMSCNYFKGINNNLSYYLNYIEETCKFITGNPYVTNCFSDTNFTVGMDKILDSMISTDINIKGVGIYNKNNICYTSAKMLGIPISDLEKNINIYNFMNSADKSQWIYRKDVFGDSFTYVLKNSDEQHKTNGYLLMNINTKKLLDFYNANHPIFAKSSAAVLVDNKDIINNRNVNIKSQISAADLSRIKSQKNGHYVSKNTNLLIIYNSIANSNIKIIVIIPLNEINEKLNLLKFTIIFLTTLAVCLSFIVSRKLNKSIVQPLNSLYYKMKSFN